jgi:uncharacterized damage-inducible protein DinB
MTWTAPPADRTEPTRLTGEREALEQWLDFHRATLLGKCAGLTGEQLTQPSVPPSRLTLLGLVRHMANVERWWFRLHGAGQDVADLYDETDDPDTDFNALTPANAAQDLQVFAQECQAARDAVAGLSLEHVVPSRGDHPERTRNLRWIYLHMIEESARHNGHADLVRECIDGATGD